MDSTEQTQAKPWVSGRGPLQRMVIGELRMRGPILRSDLIEIATEEGYSAGAARRTMRTLVDRGVLDAWTILGKWGVMIGLVGTRPSESTPVAGGVR